MHTQFNWHWTSQLELSLAIKEMKVCPIKNKNAALLTRPVPLVIGRCWSTRVSGEVSPYHETPSLTMFPRDEGEEVRLDSTPILIQLLFEWGTTQPHFLTAKTPSSPGHIVRLEAS